jgi:hypothetical protein
MVDIDSTCAASVIQRLPERVSDREWKLVKALEWHYRLVDRLMASPPAGTTVAAWIGLHRETLRSAKIIKEMVTAAGDPWTQGIPSLTHLVAQLKENIDCLKRFSSRYGNRRANPQTAR